MQLCLNLKPWSSSWVNQNVEWTGRLEWYAAGLLCELCQNLELLICLNTHLWSWGITERTMSWMKASKLSWNRQCLRDEGRRWSRSLTYLGRRYNHILQDRHPEELPGHVPEKLHLSTGLGPPWNPLIAAGGKKSGHLCLICSEKFVISTSSFLFICLSFVGSVLGSSRGFQIKKVCYGDSVNIELKSYYKGSLYFYPIAGGARKLLMDNREVSDIYIKKIIYIHP